MKNTFDNHTPNERQVQLIEELREAYKVLGARLQALKGEMDAAPSHGAGEVNPNAKRYAALAFTHLEESCMWAVKAVIFSE